ncbi:MAG: hypothetical protein JSS20_12290 [Proteobacteria bacterium]|nr:hypothetical protein [Pseudomonadota bacterium]
MAPVEPSVEAAVTRPPSSEYVSTVQKFCSSVGPTAIEARTAWQKRTIAELEQQIARSVGLLEAKITEHKEWLSKRETFAARANASIVQVFAKLNPEAAAAQLAQMEVETAAALLLKLDPKVVAPILSEVPPAKAAQISALLVDAAGDDRRHSAKGQTAAETASTDAHAEPAVSASKADSAGEAKVPPALASGQPRGPDAEPTGDSRRKAN